MKVKLGEVLIAAEGLKNLGGVQFPFKASYWLMRLQNKIEPEVKIFSAKRFELLKKLGEEVQEDLSVCCKAQVKDGNCVKCNKPAEVAKVTKKGFYKVKPENEEEFGKEIEGLVEQEIEITFEPIDMGVFGDVKISAAALKPLDKFIV